MNIDLTGTGTEKLWGDPEQTVKDIQAEILETINLPSTAGMGPNMLMELCNKKVLYCISYYL
ncbi:nucleotidyltransferase/DNA polymerase involved in DNA repair [Sporosarcina psychrophila]|uniref:Nucleotidyltransferase/DNA polymerase involved in DNA repair n=1 Tax=Sporosarcina psychrophila TaxID=1476 RepID=A0ABV2K7W3_SPOPS